MIVLADTDIKLQHFVEFHYPGGHDGFHIDEVPSGDPARIEVPKAAMGFTLFDRFSVVIKIQGVPHEFHTNRLKEREFDRFRKQTSLWSRPGERP